MVAANFKEVLPTMSLNTSLAQTVSSAVRARVGKLSSELDIAVSEGFVTLRGTARSFYEKQLILNTVMTSPGVIGLIDHVEVA